VLDLQSKQPWLLSRAILWKENDMFIAEEVVQRKECLLVSPNRRFAPSSLLGLVCLYLCF
jgi:hypothetical protein